MSSALSPDTVLEAVDILAPAGTPLTTTEVADEFDCTARTIYNKLEILVNEGPLETKKVGARGCGGDRRINRAVTHLTLLTLGQRRLTPVSGRGRIYSTQRWSSPTGSTSTT
jgi:hypothetical protein